MIGKDVSTAILRALDQEIRRRPYGTITRMNRDLGAGKNWWHQRLDSEEISAGQMVLVLEHLGLDVGRFVREIRGTAESPEGDPPPGEPPEIVVRAWQRLAAGMAGDMGRGYLEKLDRQRYRQPARVVEQALEVVDHVQLDLLPELLGIAGSAYRLWNIQLTEARHAIQAGIAMARERGDLPVVAALLQRLAYVVADRGDHAAALELSERVVNLNLRLGDRAGMARAIVDQGIWLQYLNRYREAITVLKMALELLSKEEVQNLCTAIQIIGISYRELGDPETALTYVTQAENAASELGDWARDKLLWLRANLHADLGDLDLAAGLLREVVESFARVHLGEMALAACDLVQVELQRGRPEDAFRAATRLRLLVEPLRHNQIVSAAIADLLRQGEEGLTRALVREVKARIEGEVRTREAARLYRGDSSDRQVSGPSPDPV